MLIKETIYFFGVRVDNLTLQQAISRVKYYIDTSAGRRKTRIIFFTNVHSILLANNDPDLYRCILNADLVLADGSGLDIAGRVFGKPVTANLNGTDFTPVICRMAERFGYSVFLLGARPGVAEECAGKLRKDCPGLEIAGFRHGYFDEGEEVEVVREINQCRPDILLVAMGSPLQEKWITRHCEDLNAGICFAVGGLFDFLSGEVKRAPLWIRRMGLEWVYRFLQSPREKWSRPFIEIPRFLCMVASKRLFYTNYFQR